ncbi:MAG: hypothetical protein EBZ49_02540 [Proteobacteria bacterium]|nr:hypothetical protein [Pseudomonadota bacterium]
MGWAIHADTFWLDQLPPRCRYRFITGMGKIGVLYSRIWISGSTLQPDAVADVLLEYARKML